MKVIQCLSVVITLQALLNTTSADCGVSPVYEKLKEALLTEDNINNLRNKFYPNDGSIVSEVYIQVDIHAAKQCESDFTYTLHITNLWNIKSYLRKFLKFLIFTDLTFYNVLSTLTNINDGRVHYAENFYPEGDIFLYNNELASMMSCNGSPDMIEPCLESLFSWVSDYFRLIKFCIYLN